MQPDRHIIVMHAFGYRRKFRTVERFALHVRKELNASGTGRLHDASKFLERRRYVVHGQRGHPGGPAQQTCPGEPGTLWSAMTASEPADSHRRIPPSCASVPADRAEPGAS